MTVFDLKVGSHYLIMGMGIWDQVLIVLVCDETGKPNWLPIGLFEFAVATVPRDWQFALLDGEAASGGESSDRWVARWGYSALVHDVEHSDKLIERDPAALDIFYREVAERSHASGK